MGNVNETTGITDTGINEQMKIISNFTYSKFMNQVGIQNSLSLDSRIYLKKKEKQLDSTHLQKLGDSLSYLTNLRHISIIIRDCSFNEECIKSLANGLSKLTNLEHLELEMSSCELNVSQCINLMRSISTITWINSLSLNLVKNEITNEGITQMARYLTKMTGLKELQIFIKGNPFNESSVKEVNEMLGNLHQLKIIFIDIEKQYKLLEKTIYEIENKYDTQQYLYDSGDDTS